MRTHGKIATYSIGCRCDLCKKARTIWAKKHVPKTPIVHGTYTSYVSHRCRCALCTNACRLYNNQARKPDGKDSDVLEHKLKRLTRREYIDTKKTNIPCADCGQIFHPVCMDFDHIPGRGPKLFTIARWVSGSIAKGLIDAEIAKCDIVCAICHRLRTWVERKTNSRASRAALPNG